jgi:hypothetical protein
MPEIVLSLPWSSLLDLIQSTRSELVFISPSIHDEWASAFLSLNERKDIHYWICIDNQEKNFRDGYGDIKAIKQLLNHNGTLKQCEGLKISYLGIDGMGYCFFLESRVISGGPEGLNAIALTKKVSEQIEKSFFPEKFNELMFNTLIPKLEAFDATKFQEIEARLEKNPVVLPDMQRQISVYKSHFQFVELSLEGGNLTEKSVTIPSSALPFKDEALKNKMKTRYNLFEKEDTSAWREIIIIKQKLDEIREEFLKPCVVRKGKRVLALVQKDSFQTALKDLEKLIKDSSENLITRLQKSIDEAEIVLKEELTEFFDAFPPPSAQFITDPERRKHRIETEVYQVLHKTKFPSAYGLISNLQLKYHFYDLTWEDLKDGELLDWFRLSDLVSDDFRDELASVKNAYEESR